MDRTHGSQRYVSSNLGTVLTEQGRKQKWLAQRVGVSESLIAKVIAGDRSVNARLAGRIAQELNIPLFLLFEFHDRNVLVSQEEGAAA